MTGQLDLKFDILNTYHTETCSEVENKLGGFAQLMTIL